MIRDRRQISFSALKRTKANQSTPIPPSSLEKKHRFSDNLRWSRGQAISQNSINIRSEIWRQSLTCKNNYIITLEYGKHNIQKSFSTNLTYFPFNYYWSDEINIHNIVFAHSTRAFIYNEILDLNVEKNFSCLCSFGRRF